MMPDYYIQDLTPESNLEAFKCAEGDLNDFLMDEAKDYEKELLAKTYLVVNEGNGDLIAYFSLLNDTVRLEDTDKSTANRTGCRFLTVDALASATGFYEAKGNFRFFTEKDKDDDTRLMYFDLKDFE